MPESFKISFIEIRWSFFVAANKIHIVTELMSNRYHTSNPSFNVMRRPRIPVKPASNMAKCNSKKAFFMNAVKL